MPEAVVQAIGNELHRYSRTLEAIASKERQTRLRITRKRLNGPEGLANAFARLRDNMAQPLRAVRRDDGGIAADPDEVDEVTTRAWGRIDDGVGRTHIEAVHIYAQHNTHFIYHRPTTYQLPPATDRDLRAACRGAKATAAGPDCWAPAEWRLLSDKALQEGGEWPAA